MRRLWENYDPQAIQKGEKLMPTDAFKANQGIIEEINSNRPSYKLIFGNEALKNMDQIFRRIHLLARRDQLQEGMYVNQQFAIGMGALRWKVGVLNARANRRSLVLLGLLNDVAVTSAEE